jgi:hypothetical protein
MKLAIDSDMQLGFRSVPILCSSFLLSTLNFTDLLLLENFNIFQQPNDICSHFPEEIEEE